MTTSHISPFTVHAQVHRWEGWNQRVSAADEEEEEEEELLN